MILHRVVVVGVLEMPVEEVNGDDYTETFQPKKNKMGKIHRIHKNNNNVARFL